MAIPTELVQQTRDRYEQRAAQREETSERLKTGTPLEADTPGRVQRRVSRLAATEAARERPASASVMALERILGRSDLMSVNYLEIGLQAARCVGRISIRTRTGQVRGYGTGFTVSPRLLITNNHVLDSAGQAATSRVEFNFQEDPAGNPVQAVVLNLEPERFFITDEALDFTVVALADRAADGSELGRFCWLPLIEEQGKVLVGEYLNIIQHPNGEPKQLALRENRLVDLLPDFLHYQTDTAPGSSGSPVFNDQWEVVGLHHSGVPKRDAEGNVLTRDGTVWREEMGEQRIDWIANEGVRVSRIVQRIKAERLGAEQEGLRREMLEARPSPTAPPLADPGGGGSEGVRRTPTDPHRNGNPDDGGAAGGGGARSAGDATWVIPLQVSVRLGVPATAATSGTVAVVGVPSLERPAASDRTGAAGVDAVSAGAPAPADTAEVQAALDERRKAATRVYYDAAKDQAARDAYYEGVAWDAAAGPLFEALSRRLEETHKTRPAYKPMVHVYPWVDLHSDLKLRSVYSGKPFDAEELIREDARIESERTRVRENFRSALSESSLGGARLEETLDLLEAQLPFNCEHVVPQSWFAKREPMRGDLHHLFACESGCNSFRGNIPYYDFPDFEEALRSECGKREEGRFEPSNGKGAVARATLYFLLRYPGEINAVRKELLPERVDVLLDWHRQRPPSDYERHRNAAIFEKQGNRNPLIDFPDRADRIEFRRGLGN
jgi:endonuclease G, mitochondrial